MTKTKSIIAAILLVLGFQMGAVELPVFKFERVNASVFPEDLFVPDLGSVAFDRKGNVFCFAGRQNGNECFIVKLDSSLKFIKKFGREGKGPSEFSVRNTSPDKRISIDSQGDVYVVDYNPTRIIIFDNDGNHKLDIPLAMKYNEIYPKIYNIKVITKDRLIALQYHRDKPTKGLLFSLESPKTLYQFEFSDFRIYGNEYSSYELGDVDLGFGENCVLDADDQHVVFGDGKEFRFSVIDLEGGVKFEKNEKRSRHDKFSDNEIEYIVKTNLSPDSQTDSISRDLMRQLSENKSHYNLVVKQIKNNKNAIVNSLISGKWVYVFPVREDVSVQDKFPVVIYDLSGKVYKEGYFDRLPEKIYDKYAFIFERDQEDNPILVQYDIKGLF